MVRDAEEMVGDLSARQFREDRKSQLAAARCIEGIGETGRRIIKAFPEFSDQHPELDLLEAYRMRNRLTHGYDTVDLEIVRDTALHNAPRLAEQVRTILRDLNDGLQT